jgi:hypothetical protein
MEYIHNCRCVTCDRVSSGEIAVEDNHFSGSFRFDEGLGGYVCSECDDIHNDLMNEYHEEDQLEFAFDDA